MTTRSTQQAMEEGGVVTTTVFQLGKLRQKVLVNCLKYTSWKRINQGWIPSARPKLPGRWSLHRAATARGTWAGAAPGESRPLPVLSVPRPRVPAWTLSRDSLREASSQNLPLVF